jgi:hypothetical protein
LSSNIERQGRLLELGFAFGLIPLVTSTMDRPPLMLGGRILLWGALFTLLSLQSQRDGGAFNRFLRENRTKGWLPGIAILLGVGSLLQFGLTHFGLWNPPGRLGEAGPLAGLALLLLFTVVTAIPMEALLRAYLPRRFPEFKPVLLGILLTPWLYLCTWNVRTLLLALTGGIVLAILSRSRAPFWTLPVVHGLGAWLILCTNTP